MNFWQKGILVVVLLVNFGCISEQSRTYRTLAVTFFRKSSAQQIQEFSHYSIDKQYAIYRCGTEYIHPPAFYLAYPFAAGGKPVVDLLVAKLLDHDTEDEAVMHITYVFAVMREKGIYEARKNDELMKILVKRIALMEDNYCRKYTKELAGSL